MKKSKSVCFFINNSILIHKHLRIYIFTYTIYVILIALQIRPVKIKVYKKFQNKTKTIPINTPLIKLSNFSFWLHGSVAYNLCCLTEELLLFSEYTVNKTSKHCSENKSIHIILALVKNEKLFPSSLT